MKKNVNNCINDLKSDYAECMKEAKKLKSESKKKQSIKCNECYAYGYLYALLCTGQITRTEHNDILSELDLDVL